MNSNRQITISGETEGKSLSIAGGCYRIVVSGKETNGEYAVIEMLVPPGGGPGPHAHPEIHETFYVVDGEVEFMTETGKYVAGKGAFVSIPLGGGAHGFKNKTNEVACLICTVMPAGLDEFFEEIGKPIEAGVFLPLVPPTEEQISKLKTIGERYGQIFYPPNFLDR